MISKNDLYLYYIDYASKYNIDKRIVNEAFNNPKFTERDYFQYIILAKLDNIVDSILDNNDTNITKTLNQFINDFNKIFVFFQYEDLLNIDLYFTLLSNKKLSSYVEKSLMTNREIDLKKVTEDNSLYGLYSAFCLKNNIELSDNFINYVATENSEKLLLDEIKNKPILSKDEEEYYFELYNNNDKNARKIIIECNLKLVSSVAKKYKNLNTPFLDLFESGVMGLMKAIDKFDYKKGYKFSTYAFWWIQQTIKKELAENSNLIRIPTYKYYQINKYNQAVNELHIKLERLPNDTELADYMNITIEAIKEIKLTMNDTISLEQNITNDKGESETPLEKLIEDKSLVDIEEQVSSNEQRRILYENINRLRPRDQKIIKMRFGIGYEKSFTLSEISKIFNISKEAVRRNEEMILKKLRLSLEDSKNFKIENTHNNKEDQNYYNLIKAYNRLLKKYKSISEELIITNVSEIESCYQGYLLREIYNTADLNDYNKDLIIEFLKYKFGIACVDKKTKEVTMVLLNLDEHKYDILDKICLLNYEILKIENMDYLSLI